MEDGGDGMEDQIVREVVLVSTKNKKRKVSLAEGLRAKKPKRRRLSVSANGSGGPGHNSKLARRTNVSEVTVAYTPNLPQRYGYLLQLITQLLPYKNRGEAYECSLNRIQTLIEWSRCKHCLFFEWLHKDRKMICWIFNTIQRSCVKFLVNPAFPTEILEGQVKRATCAFSLNFCSDEKWTGVKEALQMLFCPPDESSSYAPPDTVYFFTRINDCVYFRNMKIQELPDIAHREALVLKEVGPYFCLKLMDAHGEGDVRHRASDISQSEIKTKLSMDCISYYSMSPEVGSCIAIHSLYLNGEENLVLLERGQDLTVFEAYNINLQEFLEEQSFLKIKHVVGSKSEEEGLFARNIAKSIIKSIFGYFIDLFSSKKCIKMIRLKPKHVLLKGSSVQLYGLEFIEYEEKQAEHNIMVVVEFIRKCFSDGLIPCDLEDMLNRLLEDPIQNLQEAKDDSSLRSAKERRELLVYLHTEYMTNVKPKLLHARPDGLQVNNFFSDCPYLNTWFDIMEKNTYLTDVANYNALLGTLKLDKRKEEEKKKREEEERNRNGDEEKKEKGEKKMKKKEKEKERKEKEKEKERKEKEKELKEKGRKEKGEEMKKEEERVVTDDLEGDEERVMDAQVGTKGELQFHVMRNCDVHISESAVKSGITPFRLSWTDYIRSFYFPKYLSFVQRRMTRYIKEIASSDGSEELGEACRDDEEEKIVRAITSGLLANGAVGSDGNRSDDHGVAS